jgi:Protein of unknown function (DUF2783)
MAQLIRTPHIPGQDYFYAELVDSQRDLSDAQAQSLMAKLVLILANHIGDRDVLSDALALARANTLATSSTS